MFWPNITNYFREQVKLFFEPGVDLRTVWHGNKIYRVANCDKLWEGHKGRGYCGWLHIYRAQDGAFIVFDSLSEYPGTVLVDKEAFVKYMRSAVALEPDATRCLNEACEINLPIREYV